MLVLAIVYSQVSMSSNWTMLLFGLVIIAALGNRLRRRQEPDDSGGRLIVAIAALTGRLRPSRQPPVNRGHHLHQSDGP